MRPSCWILMMGLSLGGGMALSARRTEAGPPASAPVLIVNHNSSPTNPYGMSSPQTSGTPVSTYTPVVDAVVTPAPALAAPGVAAPGIAVPATEYPAELAQVVTPGRFSPGAAYYCSDCNNSRGCLPCVWGSAQYAHWWFKNASVPPLITVNTQGQAPILGAPGTSIVYGTGSIQDQGHPGGVFTLGMGIPSSHPCDRCSTWGMELSFLMASQSGTNFSTRSLGDPVLGRPYNDVATGVSVPSAKIVAISTGNTPSSGAVLVNDLSRMYSGEMNVVAPWSALVGEDWHVHLLGGVRITTLQEQLRIVELITGSDRAAEQFFVQDLFNTDNEFYGAQIGVRGEMRWDRVFVQGTGKLAIGGVDHTVRIRGSTFEQLPGLSPDRADGGLLALLSNIGKYRDCTFAVLPEAQVSIGYQFTRNIRASVGYHFLYISSVVRSGDQIDTSVNSNLIPRFVNGVAQPPIPIGPARPAFTFQYTDFWAHAITAGLDLTW